MNALYPIFLQHLQPFFLGKDAKDLDLLLEKALVYNFNFRYSGISLGMLLATFEFALRDILGRIAGKSMGQLMGEIHYKEVAVYQTTEYRELIRRDVAEYQARALKIKVGGLMFMTKDIHAVAPAGRTERMIPPIRETVGEQLALDADANGFYSPAQGSVHADSQKAISYQ